MKSVSGVETHSIWLALSDPFQLFLIPPSGTTNVECFNYCSYTVETTESVWLYSLVYHSFPASHLCCSCHSACFLPVLIGWHYKSDSLLFPEYIALSVWTRKRIYQFCISQRSHFPVYCNLVLLNYEHVFISTDQEK